MTDAEKLEPGWYWVKWTPTMEEPCPMAWRDDLWWHSDGLNWMFVDPSEGQPAIIGPRLTPPTEGKPHG